MAEYDPHSDIDAIRSNLLTVQVRFGMRDMIDRVRNYIDDQQAEQDWNTDKPLGARGEAVNNISKLESMRPTVEELEQRLFSQAQTITSQRKQLADYAKRVQRVKDMYNVQATDGNWDHSAHMFGMFVGVDVAMAALFDEHEPNQRSYPNACRVECTFQQALKDAVRQMNDVRNKNTALEISNRELREAMTNHSKFAEGARRSRQAAINDAYTKGVNEGRAEARQEYALTDSKGTQFKPKPFNAD